MHRKSAIAAAVVLGTVLLMQNDVRANFVSAPDAGESPWLGAGAVDDAGTSDSLPNDAQEQPDDYYWMALDAMLLGLVGNSSPGGMSNGSSDVRGESVPAGSIVDRIAVFALDCGEWLWITGPLGVPTGREMTILDPPRSSEIV